MYREETLRHVGHNGLVDAGSEKIQAALPNEAAGGVAACMTAVFQTDVERGVHCDGLYRQ